jgi:(p)ppGpp synthase/HD superfamily hydrolase
MEEMIQQARDLARRAHDDTGVLYNDKPYFVHPERVAKIVATLTDDPLAQVVAYLHDTVEDTQVTLDDIRAKFGMEVAEGVAALTRDKVNERYMDFVARAARQTRSRFVKLADLRANIEGFDDPACTKPLSKLEEYREAEAYILTTHGAPSTWR